MVGTPSAIKRNGPRGYQARDSSMIMVDPQLEPLRDDPRFQGPAAADELGGVGVDSSRGDGKATAERASTTRPKNPA